MHEAVRVQDLNFDMQRLIVHDGKGKKDRALPLPKMLINDLKAQIETAAVVHRDDLHAGYAGTFLPDQLTVKYKNAAK